MIVASLVISIFALIVSILALIVLFLSSDLEHKWALSKRTIELIKYLKRWIAHIVKYPLSKKYRSRCYTHKFLQDNWVIR